MIFTALTAGLLMYSCGSSGTAPRNQMYYELRIYRLKDPAKNDLIDRYLKNAFIPAMHKAGIEAVGVFRPVETDTAYGKMVYVFIPYKNMDQYSGALEVLEKDPDHQKAGREFIDAPYNDPGFARYESIFMKAFAFMPGYRKYSFDTPPEERIYELRSYESRTEAKAAKKIQMFNEGGEIAIFDEIGANAVFYGQVLFGSLRPRLMYLTTYSDMKSRDEHWNAFRAHPVWKKISVMEEYANTVISPNAYLLHPAPYSGF